MSSAPQPKCQIAETMSDGGASFTFVNSIQAVSRPGKLVSDRSLTLLEAVIDAGVDYQKANLKSVRVIRRENGHEKVHTLNLKKALQGIGGEEFYLQPQDIIFVRERFTWF